MRYPTHLVETLDTARDEEKKAKRVQRARTYAGRVTKRKPRKWEKVQRNCVDDQDGCIQTATGKSQ